VPQGPGISVVYKYIDNGISSPMDKIYKAKECQFIPNTQPGKSI